MITKTGTYMTRCGEEATVLKIKDSWAIGYWGEYTPAKWCVISGFFVEGIKVKYKPSELCLVEEKELKLFSEKNKYDDHPSQPYLDLKRVYKNMIKLVFVDKDGDIKSAGHILTITPKGLARHSWMSNEFNDYIEMNDKNRIKLIGEKDLC